MLTLNSIESWADQHHPKWLDIARFFLGLLLFAKGISFLGDRELIISMLSDTQLAFISIIAAHYVILAHTIGGLAIVFGLLTRAATAIQIPILLGAIFFVNLQKGFFVINSELEISILVLFLLIFFMVFGSGPFSVDYYLSKKDEETENS